MSTTRITTDLLIPGSGDPIADGCVVLDGASIAYAGPAEGAPATPHAATHHLPVVMPGLWECHGHFFGVRAPDLLHGITEPVPLHVARATADVRRTLEGGVTSVREVGGYGIELQRAIAEGSIPGPTIYGAGAVLSTTGGHGDLHSVALDFVEQAVQQGTWLGELCDGVPACLRAVRKQLRRGAKVIKICASGGVMSEIDHPIHQQFSGDELRAIVEEAARAERAVAAHCHGKPGIMAALEAGVTTIEHGSYLDDEAAELMVEKGAILVATRFIVAQLLGMESSLPAYAYRKGVALADRHELALKTAVANGVTLAMGTDIFVSGALYGMNSLEVRHLIDAGLTPLQAVEAATANGPLTLGPQAPQSGRLAEGYDADVIAFDANPLDDLTVWGDPSRVTHVWKAGELVKRPAAAG